MFDSFITTCFTKNMTKREKIQVKISGCVCQLIQYT